MSNPLKIVAMRWMYASVNGLRLQIPWDSNDPDGNQHFGFGKGTRSRIIAYAEGNCPHRNNKWLIEGWMKGTNPEKMHVGIDCSGYVYRVLDEAMQMSDAGSLVDTLGTTCEYTHLDTLTPADKVLHRAIEVRAGDTIRFHDGGHSGAIIETVTDESGVLREIWYTHSSYTRGPHIGWIEVGDPMKPLNHESQTWWDQMWDRLTNNGLRDLYFTSVHHSPFYLGPRPQVTKVGGVTIAVEGRPIEFAVAPYAIGGRTMAQLRPLGEAMGARVTWNNDAQRVTITRGNRTASCQVGSEVGVVNGQGVYLDEPPVFVGESVVVPVRFLAEGLGYRVDWNQAQYNVNLVPA